MIKGDRSGEWTTEQVDAHRDSFAVARDVLAGFVSPTIGNVRDYALSQVGA